MIRRIDPIGRASYGALCIGGMAALSLPVLLVVGVVAGVISALDGHAGKAVLLWLGSWGAAALAVALFLLISYIFWPLAADWIMEWPGYAVGLAIAAAALVLMALLIFVAPVPLYVAIIVPLGSSFVTGSGIAGRLAGLKAPGARPRQAARAGRRR